MVLLTWTIKLLWVSPEGNLFYCRLAIPHKLSKNLNVSLKVSIILMFGFTISHVLEFGRCSWEVINVVLC